MTMKKLVLCLSLACLTSCAGTRQTGAHMTSHADALNIIGFPLLGNDYDAAWAKVPEGATIHSVMSTPRDWTSVSGILNNIFGVTSTQVSWSE